MVFVTGLSRHVVANAGKWTSSLSERACHTGLKQLPGPFPNPFNPCAPFRFVRAARFGAHAETLAPRDGDAHVRTTDTYSKNTMEAMDLIHKTPENS